MAFYPKKPISYVNPTSRFTFIMETRINAKTYAGRKRTFRMALYRCECGKEKELIISAIHRGVIKSCGCILPEKRRNNIENNIKGVMSDGSKNYANVHSFINRKLGKAKSCSNKDCEGKSLNYQWALKKGCQYEKNTDNFMSLCTSCHRKYDFTEEMREQMSKRRKGKQPKYKFLLKPLVDIETGQEFQSLKIAALMLGINYHTLRYYFRSKSINKTSLRYKT